MCEWWVRLTKRCGRDELPGCAQVPHFPASDLAALAGEALLDVTLAWSDWCFRRVDSVHPLEGERGRRRHSMDCTPPPDPALAYREEERQERSVNDVQGPLMVPLTYVTKGPLRHFDAHDSSGQTMPILGANETTELAVEMASRMLAVDGVSVTDRVRAALADIAGPATSKWDREDVQAFTAGGPWRGQYVWEPGEGPSDDAAKLIEVFSRQFLLIALIASKDAGRRQVLKFSYHWHIPRPSWKDRLRAPLVAARFVPRKVLVPMDAAHATRSYHLEFQTPPELQCYALRLPAADGMAKAGSALDTQGMPVAHAHSRYFQQPEKSAEVHLDVPVRGAGLATLMATLFTGLVVGLGLWLPNARENWMDSSDAAIAILLAAPAIYFGLLAVRNESALATSTFRFLRTVMFLSALSLFLVAVSIVGKLEESLQNGLWFVVALWNLLVALFLATGYVVSAVQTRVLR